MNTIHYKNINQFDGDPIYMGYAKIYDGDMYLYTINSNIYRTSIEDAINDAKGIDREYTL